jgi:hypothetical protein
VCILKLSCPFFDYEWPCVCILEISCLLFDYELSARQFYEETRNPNYASSSYYMQGSMVDANGNEVPGVSFAQDKSDIFPLSILLSAALVDLKDKADYSQTPGPPTSMRNSGIIILVCSASSFLLFCDRMILLSHTLIVSSPDYHHVLQPGQHKRPSDIQIFWYDHATTWTLLFWSRLSML